MEINNEGDLFSTITNMAEIKKEYDTGEGNTDRPSQIDKSKGKGRQAERKVRRLVRQMHEDQRNSKSKKEFETTCRTFKPTLLSFMDL